MKFQVHIAVSRELVEALERYPEEIPELFGDRILYHLEENSPYDDVTPRGTTHIRLKDSWGYTKPKTNKLEFFNDSYQHYFLRHGNLPLGKKYIEPKKKKKGGAKVLAFPWRRMGGKMVFYKRVKGIKPNRKLFEIGKTYRKVINDSVKEGLIHGEKDLQAFLDHNGKFDRLTENKRPREFIRMPGTARRYIHFKTEKVLSRHEEMVLKGKRKGSPATRKRLGLSENVEETYGNK